MGHATGSERRIVIRWRIPGKAEAIGNTLHRAYPADKEQIVDEAERNIWNPEGSADKLD